MYVGLYICIYNVYSIYIYASFELENMWGFPQGWTLVAEEVGAFASVLVRQPSNNKSLPRYHIA